MLRPPNQGREEGGAVAAEPPLEEAFTTVTVGDNVADKDCIGFEPYVRAVAEFLEDPGTEPPLTLSIEGEWGSGKSSFMRQLSHALKERGIGWVWFNAWRHDKDESLWSSFALEFSRSAARRLGLGQRCLARLELFLRRMGHFDYAGSWPELIRLAWMLLVYTSLGVFAVAYLAFRGPAAFGEIWNYVTTASRESTDLRTFLSSLGGTAGAAIVMLFLLERLKKVVGDPLGIDLKKYRRLPDYETRVSFIERFHEDFADIAAAYSGGRRLCVFIDDIDRCEPPKAADLMQAINLMIPDCKNLIFVIGMDRTRVAASVAVKHEKLLPYLTRRPAHAGDPKDEIDRPAGLAFGYGFIDKFIQVPFRVPRVDEAGVRTLLGALRERNRELEPSFWERTSAKLMGFLDRRTRREQPAARLPAGDGRDEAVESLRQNLRHQESRITLMVAKPLNYNPRRLKQFINSFRLTSYFAFETGVLDPYVEGHGGGKLTLDLIGRFVAVTLEWPDLLSGLDEDPELLGDLQELAILEKNPLFTPTDVLKPKGKGWCPRLDSDVNPEDPKVVQERRNQSPLGRWSRTAPLMELLSTGTISGYGGVVRFGFGSANLEKLLRVSPARRPPVATPGPSNDSIGSASA